MPTVLASARTYCGRLEDVVGSPRRSSWRILFVDDNKDFADCLAALLRHRGHTIRVAYDGPTALQAARLFRPQIVFSDLGLPGLAGHEVARHLRRDPDQKGYSFWVNILSSGDLGTYRGMVCSFVTSREYQLRFSAVVSHNDGECGQ